MKQIEKVFCCMLITHTNDRVFNQLIRLQQEHFSDFLISFLQATNIRQIDLIVLTYVEWMFKNKV